MRVIGLTGGIASGKSTVAGILAGLGAPVVDADQVAREVVEPGHDAYNDIVATFGREILSEDGKIERKKLGAIVFGDADKRRQLNAITHPRIAAATQAKLAELGQAGTPVAIYEAALLVENKVHLGLDGLIVVSASEENQIARAAARDNFTEEEARARVQAQAPLADKVAVADFVIDTNGSLDDTARQVREVWDKIVAGAPKRL
jgi:dephospho-CoA kinase